MALIRGNQITGSVASANYALTASYALNAGNAGNSGATFPFTGSAIISGSLIVTGGFEAIYFIGSLLVNASQAISIFYALCARYVEGGFY